MRRQRIEIIRDVLSFCTKPKKGYQIQLKCNISYAIISAILPMLLTSQCLETRKNSPRVYITTEKGKQFIQATAEVFALLQN